MSVYFGGSRSLPPSAILAQVVSAVLASGQAVHVGCSAGADQQVIQSAIGSSSFQQVRVFAVGGASGAGFWSGSAVPVVQSFAGAGGSVRWWAGGVPPVPFSARLILRSVAAFSGCNSAVFFQPGAGSLSVAGRAVAAGLQVFAFSQSAPASMPGCAGSWVASSFAGFACWLWSSAQLSFL